MVGPVTAYPNGFSSTLTVLGQPLVNVQGGRSWWVNSATGMDGNPGTFQRPFATLARATDFMGAGDFIMVAAGHTETWSAATTMTMDVAGVSVVGLGVGNNRPTFTLDTVAGTTVNVSAAGVSFVNCLFQAGYAGITSVFTLTTANAFLLDGCAFRRTSTNYAQYIVDTNTTSNDADWLQVINCEWHDASTTAVTMVKMDGSNNNIHLIGNSVNLGVSNNTPALLAIATTKNIDNLNTLNNNVNRKNTDTSTGAILITTDVSTNTGVVAGNFAQTADTTGPLMVTASSGLGFSQNYGSGVVGASGFLLPAADS